MRGGHGAQILRRPQIALAVGARRENSLLVAGGLAVASGALGAREIIKLMEARKKAAEANPGGPAGAKAAPGADGGAAAGSSSSWFGGDLFGKRFYEGPFEDTMTRREAALILGVRESATAQRIKDAHRRILRINHPDMGGSAFLSAKVNEAKELLIKGKEDPKDGKN